MFSWLFRKKSSASIAKERLQIAIMSDRVEAEYNFMEDLKKDIIDVIHKYKKVANIEIKKVKEEDVNIISIEVEVDANTPETDS
jgi:cell division topological specificity factor MinE